MLNTRILLLSIFFIFLNFATVFAQESECHNLDDCLSNLNFNKLDIGNTNQGCELDDTNEQKKIKQLSLIKEDNWKYVAGGLAMAPLALVGGTAVHELSHAYFIDKYGFEIVDIKILPYTNEETGYSYFGSTSWLPDERENGPPTPKEDLMISLAPMMTDATLISIYSSLALANKLPKNKWGKTTALVFLGAYPTVDLITHLSNSGQYTDSGDAIKDLQNYKNMSEEDANLLLRSGQALFVAYGALGVGLEAYRILSVENPKNSKNYSLMPSLINGETPGINIQGNF